MLIKSTNYFLMLGLLVSSISYAGGVYCPPGDPGDGKCLPRLGNSKTIEISEQLSVSTAWTGGVKCLFKGACGGYIYSRPVELNPGERCVTRAC